MNRLYKSLRTAFFTLNLSALIAGLLLILDSVPVSSADETVSSYMGRISLAETAIGTALVFGSLSVFWLAARRGQSASFVSKQSMTEVLRDFFQRYFPERQLYHRANRHVQFMTLSAPVQMSLLVISMGFLTWVAFASVNVVFSNQILMEHKQRIVRMQIAYEDRLAEASSLRNAVYETVLQCVELDCPKKQLIDELTKLGPSGEPRLVDESAAPSPLESISILTKLNRWLFQNLKTFLERMSVSATGQDSIGLDDADYFSIYLSVISAFFGGLFSCLMLVAFVMGVRSFGNVTGPEADRIIDELNKDDLVD